MPAGHSPTEVIKRDAGREQLLLQRAALKVTRGPDRGRQASLSGGRLMVGTDSSCDLVLADQSVSRRQFELCATELGFLLRDLDSTNGTFVGPLRIREALISTGTRILVGRSELQFSPMDEREELDISKHESFGLLLGRSPVMRRCFALLEQAAATDSTVLIEGESGTGKELAARSLHQASPRAAQPFVVVDCGAMPASLIESELFGHEKGAFTDASQARVGAFEAADGGTLFLDEIGELDRSLQPKLLRFLEEREVRRVGGNSARRVDVRIVAATNRRLERMVEEQAFRQDLFYRLAVIRLELPPLRARGEDVSLLGLALAAKLRPDADPASWLADSTIRALSSYDWPGNVRELRNVIERMAALPNLDLTSLLQNKPSRSAASTVTVLSDLTYHDAKERVLDAFERDYVAALLTREQGVVARAAEVAGVPRQTFFRLIRKHGLEREPA